MKDFSSNNWTPEEVNEETTFAFNRWSAEQQKLREAEAQIYQQFEGKSTDEIAEEWKQAAAQEEAKKRPLREYWSARTFIAERPDYVVSAKNGMRIEAYMKEAGLDTTNVDDIHAAAKALEARGLLDLDLNKIPVAPRTRVTEEEMYALPMEELQARAEREAGRRR